MIKDIFIHSLKVVKVSDFNIHYDGPEIDKKDDKIWRTMMKLMFYIRVQMYQWSLGCNVSSFEPSCCFAV